MAKKSQKRIGKLVFKNEKSFRRVLVQSIEDSGGHAQAIEATTGAGIPDLYYTTNDRALGPTWAELKIVRRGDKVGLRKRQFHWLVNNAGNGGCSELIINNHKTGQVLLVLIGSQTFEQLNSISWIEQYLSTIIDPVETRDELDIMMSSD